MDYTVCRFCQDVGRAADADRGKRSDMYGVSYAYFPIDEVRSDGD